MLIKTFCLKQITQKVYKNKKNEFKQSYNKAEYFFFQSEKFQDTVTKKKLTESFAVARAAAFQNSISLANTMSASSSSSTRASRVCKIFDVVSTVTIVAKAFFIQGNLLIKSTTFFPISKIILKKKQYVKTVPSSQRWSQKNAPNTS